MRDDIKHDLERLLETTKAVERGDIGYLFLLIELGYSLARVESHLDLLIRDRSK